MADDRGSSLGVAGAFCRSHLPVADLVSSGDSFAFEREAVKQIKDSQRNHCASTDSCSSKTFVSKRVVAFLPRVAPSGQMISLEFSTRPEIRPGARSGGDRGSSDRSSPHRRRRSAGVPVDVPSGVEMPGKWTTSARRHRGSSLCTSGPSSPRPSQGFRSWPGVRVGPAPILGSPDSRLRAVACFLQEEPRSRLSR